MRENIKFFILNKHRGGVLIVTRRVGKGYLARLNF